MFRRRTCSGLRLRTTQRATIVKLDSSGSLMAGAATMDDGSRHENGGERGVGGEDTGASAQKPIEVHAAVKQVQLLHLSHKLLIVKAAHVSETWCWIAMSKITFNYPCCLVVRRS
ncbi:hypothetical protein L7F22_063695 [Adiantum nelumboides]|nr:hypothetical protein [Adiantum nelumboides]